MSIAFPQQGAKQDAIIDTVNAFAFLRQSSQDLCEAFNRHEFMPLLEADVTAFLYHRLLIHGCPLSWLYKDTRIRGVEDERRKYDLVVGKVDTKHAWVDPVLIVQVKCFQRWGHTSQQHRIRFEAIIYDDLVTLKDSGRVLSTGRVQLVTDFVLTSRGTGYLTGIWQDKIRRDELSRRCEEIGASLLWVRPNGQDCLEVEQLA
jgi:hypothetical protein